MGKEINIILEGQHLVFRKMERPVFKGVYAKTVIGFNFYAAEYNGCEFILLEPNEKRSKRYTLTQFSNLSKAVNDVLGKTIAFLFDHQIYHEENLMPNNRGVYFIFSDEYAFLPFLFEDLPYCVRQINTNNS